jgi:hypothetical protein
MMVVLLGMVGCVEDKFNMDKLSTDMEVSPSFSAPLAKGSLTLDDLVNDESGNLVYDSSDAQGPFFKFVYREDSIFSYGGSDFFGVNESGSDGYTLGNISIDPFGPVSDTVTLREIVNNASSRQTEAQAIESADGSNIIFPAISESNPMEISGKYKSDAIDNFRVAHIQSGEVDLTLTNELPVEVTVEFTLGTQILDQSGNFVEKDRVIQTAQFSGLAANTNMTKTIDLSGEEIGAILYITDLKLSTPGSSSQVTINLDDQSLNMEAQSTELVISRGEVAIKDQTLNDQTTKVATGYSGARRLDTVRLQGGTISYTIENLTELSASLELVFPESTDLSTGNPLTVNQAIDPQTTTTNQVNLANTRTVLNGADSIPIQYNLQLGSTQDFVAFDAHDQLSFDYTIDLNSEDAEYISGFFGQETIDLPQEEIETGFELFNTLEGDFTLTNPSIRLFYASSIGIPFTADMDMVAQSGSETKNLNEGNNNGLLHFNRPRDPESVLDDTLVIDNNNSDISQFISLPPEKILFDGTGYINYNKSSSTYNYLTSEPNVHVGMEIALPMELQTSGLTYRDSFAFDMDVDFEEAVRLFGKFSNEMPFSIDLQVVCRDSTTNQDLLNLEAVDASGSPVQMLEAPELDEDGIVDAPSENLVYFNIEGDDIDLLNQTNQLVVVATIATSGNQGVKFYTNYTLDFRFGIDETGTTVDL